MLAVFIQPVLAFPEQLRSCRHIVPDMIINDPAKLADAGCTLNIIPASVYFLDREALFYSCVFVLDFCSQRDQNRHDPVAVFDLPHVQDIISQNDFLR